MIVHLFFYKECTNIETMSPLKLEIQLGNDFVSEAQECKPEISLCISYTMEIASYTDNVTRHIFTLERNSTHAIIFL